MVWVISPLQARVMVWVISPLQARVMVWVISPLQVRVMVWVISPLQARVMVWVMLIFEDAAVTVKVHCKTAIKVLFLYLYLNVKF
jgi:hypothetical protein